MGERNEALEKTMSDLKSVMQAFAHQVQQRGLILRELSKQLGLKIEDNAYGESHLSGK
ncbi:hypothetical protein A2U01_0077873, partial [Trifolium medium]|nr:hypothetical protein [Trifolium medium]